MRSAALLLVVTLVLTACSSGSTDSPALSGSEPSAASEPSSAVGELYPDVIAATATKGADGTWEVSATLSSPYDSAERYADAWRVLAPDGTELGVRELAHDHAGEQPFTRSLTGVEIPEGTAVVTIEGRDQVSGWGGVTVDIDVQP